MKLLRVPTCTYRLQCNPELGFDDAASLLTYLQRLGVTDLCLSPVLEARRGSRHGYDVVDHETLNLELGGDAAFDRLASGVSDPHVGLIVDIVPNHMAASSENPWWTNVLENGRASAFADVFDIDWGEGQGLPQKRIVLPILGTPRDDALQACEVMLSLEDSSMFSATTTVPCQWT
jgi:(1->4)-alpha-D-glucan 1-alpha-D-glucosylmutase